MRVERRGAARRSVGESTTKPIETKVLTALPAKEAEEAEAAATKWSIMAAISPRLASLTEWVGGLDSRQDSIGKRVAKEGGRGRVTVWSFLAASAVVTAMPLLYLPRPKAQGHADRKEVH